MYDKGNSTLTTTGNKVDYPHKPCVYIPTNTQAQRKRRPSAGWTSKCHMILIFSSALWARQRQTHIQMFYGQTEMKLYIVRKWYICIRNTVVLTVLKTSLISELLTFCSSRFNTLFFLFVLNFHFFSVPRLIIARVMAWNTSPLFLNI